MLNPANIFRSDRRTISLYVDPSGELIVKAPKSVSDRKIFEFVKEKHDWIEARMRAVAKNKFINRDVVSYNAFFFMGRVLTPVISGNVKTVTQSNDALLIPAKLVSGKIQKRIEKFYKDTAKAIIKERCDYFSQILKLKYTDVSINNNQTRWGTCARTGEISINWRAVMLAPHVFDYLIVHEFCHLLEFNHTKNFWAVVASILPDFQKSRLELKHMGYLLQLFRNTK